MSHSPLSIPGRPRYSNPCNSHLQTRLLQLTLCRPSLNPNVETSTDSKCSSPSSNEYPLEITHTTTLQQLHWLPVEFRIKFKVLVLTFKAICGSGPGYLRDRLSLYFPQRTLRSSDTNLLEIPNHQAIRLAATRKRAFSALAPSWWNELPTEIRAMTELSQFRKACKTTLFRQAFG